MREPNADALRPRVHVGRAPGYRESVFTAELVLSGSAHCTFGARCVTRLPSVPSARRELFEIDPAHARRSKMVHHAARVVHAGDLANRRGDATAAVGDQRT